MQTHWSFWLGFNLFVLVMLALDLGVFHRKSHQIKFKEALGWSAFWIALAFAFAALLAFWQGRQPALEFITGYVVEESLSVDNLFVFLVLFRYPAPSSASMSRQLVWDVTESTTALSKPMRMGPSRIPASPNVYTPVTSATNIQ